ncbi:hypothetical protein ACUNWD_09015 [Sunxiuqinia sp. A32]|uniref:hypothetical protein n=1 Tax=Sunxiuqinia sp. A32 TaxID=3461496 RepID=UPI004045ED53
MKRLTILAFLLIAVSGAVFSQTPTNPIVMKKVFGGYLFYQNDQRLTMSKLVKAMEPNEQAYQEIKAARGTFTFATIVGGAGGFMLGWPIGGALAGDDMNWTMAGIGVGLIVVSIPITQKFNRQAKSAVNTFNGELKSSSFFNRTEINLAANGNGIGLVMKF